MGSRHKKQEHPCPEKRNHRVNSGKGKGAGFVEGLQKSKTLFIQRTNELVLPDHQGVVKGGSRTESRAGKAQLRGIPKSEGGRIARRGRTFPGEGGGKIRIKLRRRNPEEN